MKLPAETWANLVPISISEFLVWFLPACNGYLPGLSRTLRAPFLWYQTGLSVFSNFMRPAVTENSRTVYSYSIAGPLVHLLHYTLEEEEKSMQGKVVKWPSYPKSLLFEWLILAWLQSFVAGREYMP